MECATNTLRRGTRFRAINGGRADGKRILLDPVDTNDEQLDDAHPYRMIASVGQG